MSPEASSVQISLRRTWRDAGNSTVKSSAGSSRTSRDEIHSVRGAEPTRGVYVPKEGDFGGVLNHILIALIDETSRKTGEAGGKMILTKQEIPIVGCFAVFENPGGSVLAPSKGTPKHQQ